jgi:Signal transduction histidine kinase
MRRKILAGALAVAVVTLSVGIVAVVLIRSSIRERAQEELFRQAEVTAGFLEEELTGITVDPTRVGAEQRAAWRTKVAAVLRQARLVGGHDIVEAELVTGGRSVSLVRNPKLLSVLPVGTRERTVVRVEVDGTPMLATVRSFPFGRRSEIVVAIGRSEPLLPVRFVTRTLLLALAVGAVLVVGLGLWFARSTTGRLRHLEEASLRLAGGDLAARVPVEGHDELTALARAFNEMADQLEGVRGANGTSS